MQLSTPKVAVACEVKGSIGSYEVSVLLDSGAQTQFIKRSVAEKLKLKTGKVETVSVTSFLANNPTVLDKGAEFELKIGNERFDMTAYIDDNLKQDVLLGHGLLPRLNHLIGAKDRLNIEANTVEVENWVIKEYDDLRSVYAEAVEVLVIQAREINTDNRDTNGFEELPSNLVNQFKDTVRDDLPPRKQLQSSVSHTINLKEDSQIPQLQPYRLTPKLTTEVDHIIKDLLDKDFITTSKSEFSSPIVLVKKKDGTYRLCVDYRQLNKVTRKDPFPLPHIDELLGRIGDASIFSTLDLHSGYHQIPMAKEDQSKTAFVTPSGKYEYKVMPFGLVNAPSTFSRYMAELFRGLPFVNVYLDDILVFSKSKEEHWKHLEKVLGIIQKEKLIAKRKKCHFAKESVEFLGYIVGKSGIRPIQSKVDAIANMPPPKSVKEAQRFLGMVNYYRKFIKRCSVIAKPISEFISGSVGWTKAQDTSFQQLKDALISKPVLVAFKHKGGQYRLTTDASKQGLGAVLEEVDGNKVIGVVGYFSKGLSTSEKNYYPGKLELLGIVKALEHFKYMLHGKTFRLRTDHISLLAIRNNKEPGQRVREFLSFLSEFDFELEYLPGPKNVVADPISRARYEIEANATNLLQVLHPNHWSNDYKKDPWCASVCRLLDPGFSHDLDDKDINVFLKYCKKYDRAPHYMRKFAMIDHILYFNKKICVPQIHRTSILDTYHDHRLFGGHFGIQVTHKKITARFFWPGCYQSVKEYVISCHQCQLNKSYKHKAQGLTQPLDCPQGRWEDLSVDFVLGLPTTKNGYNMIMVVVDRFSKRAHFIPVIDTFGSAEVIDTFFRFVFAYHGFPKSIVSDRDVRFTSAAYKEFNARFGTKLLFSSSNHPQTDGQTERVNRTLGQLLKFYASNNQLQWDRFLPQVEFVYNTTIQVSLGMSPFEADLGWNPNDPVVDVKYGVSMKSLKSADLAVYIDALTTRVREFLENKSLDMESTSNKTRVEIRYEVGDLVLLHRDAYFTKGKYRKIRPIYLGPFKVVKVGINNCEVDLPSHVKNHRVINIQWLKKYVKRTDAWQQDAPRTEAEKLMRVSEINAIVGIDDTREVVYCKMERVDPELVVEYTWDQLGKLADSQLYSLVRNFTQLEGEVNERGTE